MGRAADFDDVLRGNAIPIGSVNETARFGNQNVPETILEAKSANVAATKHRRDIAISEFRVIRHIAWMIDNQCARKVRPIKRIRPAI